MALPAHKTGFRVSAANTTLGVYEAQGNRTGITGTDSGEHGDLLASLLVDLHHWANAHGLDWGSIEAEAADEYREQTGGPVYR